MECLLFRNEEEINMYSNVTYEMKLSRDSQLFSDPARELNVRVCYELIVLFILLENASGEIWFKNTWLRFVKLACACVGDKIWSQDNWKFGAFFAIL